MAYDKGSEKELRSKNPFIFQPNSLYFSPVFNLNPDLMNWRLSVFFIPFVYFLSCATSEGQNWSPFRVDIRMLYGVESELPKFGSLHLMGKLIIPFQVDTLTGSPSTGYTFGYSDSLQLSNSGNWLGAPVFGPGFITSQFGEFSIQGGMNMTFLPKVIEGSVAAVLRIQGNVALRAVVVRKGLDSVLSVTDSVATLKWIPEAGYELLSLANDTTFLLSRSFGLIRFRNL